ncbi:MtnX-like HAD-IB family phosphatase [Alicyclobacillus macrosporangiidus]|uniref:2-hydroxy-3-keto-5-methylthiopentenyl-1-phosphate phosphatase n=1 Tax=Alicyclobacillus macrosporangiidus TaxID=392015 RepID=A0A1I7KZS4_9BACL|nr:MtnX-like HAD-IB family phosphatase [Alicyclobacillus macrosporangiidus]SFV02983.1 2-hydroxy-3-keto-5-methylthiopentenyl-1-phosphatephosphatase [Alicyclobacillus macrosporangiidus]
MIDRPMPDFADGAWDVFCDFDGTISENDMIAQIMKRFVPEAGLELMDRVNRHELTVQEGVEQMFARIPSSRFGEVRDFAVTSVRLRQGFPAFVRLCRERGWRLTVVSGGFDFFVEPALAPFRDRLDVVCNRIDASGSHLRVVWSTPCDAACEGGCGLCKPAVLRYRQRPGVRQMLVGDGVTDAKAARVADFVFARDRLRGECDRMGIPSLPFETFDDIVARLADVPRDQGVAR